MDYNILNNIEAYFHTLFNASSQSIFLPPIIESSQHIHSIIVLYQILEIITNRNNGTLRSKILFDSLNLIIIIKCREFTNNYNTDNFIYSFNYYIQNLLNNQHVNLNYNNSMQF